MPEKFLLLATAKPYAITFIMGVFASGLRYSQDIKAGRQPSFWDFVAFFMVVSAIVFSTLAGMMHIGFELGFPAFMIIFWTGVASPYLYDLIISTLKKKSEQIAKKLI